MDHVVERRGGAHEAALRAAHRPPPGRPVRGGVAPGPLKVYCVEPRDFRELVQRLTGPETATPTPAPPMGARQRVMHAPAAIPQHHGRMQAATAAPEQLDYASWFSAPLLSPAYAPAGFDGGHHGSGAFMDHVERRNGAHEAALRGAHRPVRGGVVPGPLKVHCVEPRDFRELVQRLTGAETAAT
ncbi:hypothetical protein EJB05_05211, partial [Eragrostis curvula]